MEYRCSSCGKRLHRTYEVVNKDVGKKEYLGHYSTRYGCEGTSHAERSYKFIDEEFKKMWGCEYNFLTKNCKDWSREFFNRIS